VFIALIAILIKVDDYMWEYHLNEGCRAGVKLGAETLQADEAAGIQAVIDTLDPFLSRRLNGTLDDPSPDGLAKRVQHPRTWSCSEGTLEVNAELAPHLRHGIFAQPGASFKASIRTSHSGFEPDSDPKGTSIAVKLHGVDGNRLDLGDDYHPKLRELNADSQDFIFAANPWGTFDIATKPGHMADLHEVQMKAGLMGILFGMLRRPLSFYKILVIILGSQQTTNPFLSEHNTLHSHRLGGEDTAAKYILKPCPDSAPMPAVPEGKKFFIPEIIAQHVASEGVCMDMFVQRQTDSCADSIENLRYEWTGPLEHVAKLSVPVGGGDRDADDTTSCEFTTFSPWYGLEEHRPLGWVARLRRKVYETSASLRMKKTAKCPFSEFFN
jgi:hypothetical protein